MPEADRYEIETHAHEVYRKVQLAITYPWIQQVRQRRRRDGPHVNAELCKLWVRKKLLYDRQRCNPTRAIKTRYKEICATVQWRERQLEREQKRRLRQRIQQEPTTHLAKALQLSAQRSARQIALDTTVSKLLRPRQDAAYLNQNMAVVNGLQHSRLRSTRRATNKM